MPIVTEHHLSNERDITWITEERTRIFYVELDENTDTVDTAGDATGIPDLGDSHPRNAFIFLQRKTVERVEGSANPPIAKVICYYSNTSFVSDKILIEWDISPIEQYADVDLDGKSIGNPYFFEINNQGKLVETFYLDEPYMDDDAVMGVSILTSHISLRVKMFSPAFFSIALCVGLRNHVNSKPFYGIPKGYCQYLGPVASQTGKDSVGQPTWEVIHNFRAGYLRVPDPSGNGKFKDYGLAYIAKPQYTRNPGSFLPNGTKFYTKSLIGWSIHRMYSEGDFSLLLGPQTPHTP